MYEDLIIPPPPDRDEPFRLHLAGVSHCDGSYVIERQPCELYVFEYVESGRGVLCVGKERFFPAAGDVYVVPAWSVHRYASDAAEPWTKYWFNVSGRLVEMLLEAYQLTGVCWFRNCPIGDCFKRGLAALQQQSPEVVWREAPAIITGIVHELAWHYTATRREAAHISPEGRKVRQYLERHLLDAPPTLEQLAGLIGRSAVQTIRIFRRDFQVTPIQYLLNRKMAAAGELLKSSNLTVKEIAGQLGFEDEYYFSRLFKRKMGLAPAYFRAAR